jgi:hypothetical protein
MIRRKHTFIVLNSKDDLELKIKYKRKAAMVKRALRKIKWESWAQSTCDLKHDVHR